MNASPDMQWFEAAIGTLETMVPPPAFGKAADGQRELKFIEKTIEQVLLLKLARYVSSLQAAVILSNAGFLIEVGALQRILDEAGEDITFLALACYAAELEEIHKDYLRAFWDDEPTFVDFSRKPRKRYMPPRDKIQAHIERSSNDGKEDHLSLSAAKYLSRNYSGYVHSAAPHLMLLVHPATLKLQVSGISYLPLRIEIDESLKNQIYRGVVAVAMTARALNHTQLHSDAMNIHRQMFETFGYE